MAPLSGQGHQASHPQCRGEAVVVGKGHSDRCGQAWPSVLRDPANSRSAVTEGEAVIRERGEAGSWWGASEMLASEGLTSVLPAGAPFSGSSS